MSACDREDVISGGFIEDSTLRDNVGYNNEFTDTVLTNTELKGSVSIDRTASKEIVEQLCEDIKACVAKAVAVGTPRSLESGDIPTTIVGEDFTVIMGRPFAWVESGIDGIYFAGYRLEDNNA